jgi:hypothetical protein
MDKVLCGCRRDGGSFGQTIPGVPVQQASVAGTGQAATLRTVVDQKPGFHADLGIVNVTGVPVTAVVEIFTADGELAPGDSPFSVELEPYGITQIGDVLAPPSLRRTAPSSPTFRPWTTARTTHRIRRASGSDIDPTS